MPVSLISNDLLDRFLELMDVTKDELNIISPFIGTQTATMLADWLVKNPAIKCNIITRFYREDFVERVSSIYGLERLLHAKANIYALLRKRKNVRQGSLQSMHFRRSHIRITQEASSFLMDELNKRFSKYGEIYLG